MEGLKSLSCRKFEFQLQQHWISDTLADCIRDVYLTSKDIDSDATRRAVVNTVSLYKQELVRKRPFQELIREVGDFAVDLVSVMAKSTTRASALPKLTASSGKQSWSSFARGARAQLAWPIKM